MEDESIPAHLAAEKKSTLVGFGSRSERFAIFYFLMVPIQPIDGKTRTREEELDPGRPVTGKSRGTDM